MADASERFLKLVESTRREGVEERHPEPPAPPSPEAALINALGSWASDEKVAKVFLPWLEGEMERAILESHRTSRRSGAQALHWLSYEAGMRYVRDSFVRWAGRTTSE
jgi:hypothetical protein